MISLAFAGNIEGRISDAANRPIEGATVRLLGGKQGAISNKEGIFSIQDIPAGPHTLEVSHLGYEKVSKEVTVSASGTLKVAFRLAESSAQLDEVVISEKTESQKRSESPIQIASIDVKALQSESSDVVSVLDRTAGVRVRQSGGLGSRTSIQLNGLSGLAVRTYYDGIPLELLGGGIQLNNIPVNTVERVDIYKGVMPIDVGTDALAGGINVITRQVDFDYLDASYQIGSFNTHVATLNAAKKLGEHFLLSVSSFFNYSDNSYKIRARQRTPNFQEIDVEVNRFHSAHQSSMVKGSIGVLNVKWADKLSYNLSYNQRFDEIQHGVRLGNRAVGEADLSRNVLIHSLIYRKAFLNNRLRFDYFGNYSFANEAVDDSTTNVYDWFGEVVAQNNQGMEVLALPSQRTGTSESHIHRANLAFLLSTNHTIKASSFLSNQQVVGEDPLAPKVGDNNPIDPNTLPSFLTRSISGLSLESKWFGEKLESILFGKYYYYDQSTTDIRPTGASQVFSIEQQAGEPGYGLGLKYTIKEGFFFRSSFEQAIRIPTKDEVFGNFLTIEPNFFLEPERSKNLNIGAFYRHNFSDEQYVSLDVNGFLRDQSNLIRLEAGRNENDPAQFINEEEADGRGIELSIEAAPVRDLVFSGSFTLQEVVRDGEPNATNTNGIGNPIPNIPSRFFNLSLRYSFQNPLSQKDEVSVFSYYTFVDEFDFIFQTTRNEENIIPVQRQLDAGLTYKIGQSGFTFTFEAGNILNTEVFDNYRVPRPGRNFTLKIRYLFQKV
ncbi:MAG: TonB-dependent receptor [Bacteroidota bacterium]